MPQFQRSADRANPGHRRGYRTLVGLAQALLQPLVVAGIDLIDDLPAPHPHLGAVVHVGQGNLVSSCGLQPSDAHLPPRLRRPVCARPFPRAAKHCHRAVGVKPRLHRIPQAPQDQRNARILAERSEDGRELQVAAEIDVRVEMFFLAGAVVAVPGDKRLVHGPPFGLGECVPVRPGVGVIVGVNSPEQAFEDKVLGPVASGEDKDPPPAAGDVPGARSVREVRGLRLPPAGLLDAAVGQHGHIGKVVVVIDHLPHRFLRAVGLAPHLPLLLAVGNHEHVAVDDLDGFSRQADQALYVVVVVALGISKDDHVPGLRFDEAIEVFHHEDTVAAVHV